MGIKLFDVPGRMVQSEMTANISRKKTGYKMSRKGRNLLGISADTSAYLAIGKDESDNSLWIKAVSGTDNSNASVSKLNMITSKGIVSVLNDLGNTFEITNIKDEDGFFKMIPSVEETEEESVNTTNTFNNNTTNHFDSFGA